MKYIKTTTLSKFDSWKRNTNKLTSTQKTKQMTPQKEKNIAKQMTKKRKKHNTNK